MKAGRRGALAGAEVLQEDGGRKAPILASLLPCSVMVRRASGTLSYICGHRGCLRGWSVVGSSGSSLGSG